jgi:hypothetical protein
VLKTVVANARFGREGEFAALKRPDDQARQLEGYAIGQPFGRCSNKSVGIHTGWRPQRLRLGEAA